MPRKRMSVGAESSHESLAPLEVIVPTRQSGWCDCWTVGHTNMQLDDCHIASDNGQRVRCEPIEHGAAKLKATLAQSL